MAVTGIDLGKYKLGWSDSTDDYVYTPKKGLNEDVVREISHRKSEPEWMTKFRLNALKRFERKPMLEWFAKNMPDIDFDDIYYYLKPTEGQVSDWDMLPEEHEGRRTRSWASPRPSASSSPASPRSTSPRSCTTRTARTSRSWASCSPTWTPRVREYPEIVQQHFGTVIPPGDNKFAALNSAVWSGGSFIYVPPGVHVDMPLQAYFRINAENAGQFERTLIIADEGASVHYVEGCSAPVYSTDSLHSRRRRADRQAGCTHPLHDDPELVAQRLQPRHQAGACRDRGDRRVDRRQPRLEAHDEVPGRRDDRPEGARRGAVGRVRGRGPAPGRRRQDDPRRARDHVDHRLEVDLEGRRPHHLPRPGEGRGGRAPRRRATCAATR